MDNEKADENISNKNYGLKSEDLNEYLEHIKLRTKESILNSQFLHKAQDISKEFIKNYFFLPISDVFSRRFPEIRNALFNNQIVNIPMTVIEKSNYKNMIDLKFNNTGLKITHTDRKISVLVLTITGTIVHYLRSSKNKFKFKWLIPYYAFFSLILCRENLDPYGI